MPRSWPMAMRQAERRVPARHSRTSGVASRDAARFSPFQRSPFDVLMGRWTMDTSPLFLAFDLAARLFSPYDLNPRGTNPLRDILAECVDFGRRRAIADPAVRHRHQCAHRPRPGVPQCRAYAGRAACFRLPPDASSRRSRSTASRTGTAAIAGNPDHHAAGARVLVERHRAGAGQPGRAPRHAALRARNHQPRERGFLQRHLVEGTAHDRGRCGRWPIHGEAMRGRAVGRECASTASPATA